VGTEALGVTVTDILNFHVSRLKNQISCSS
jgi:hypothetical protein